MNGHGTANTRALWQGTNIIKKNGTTSFYNGKQQAVPRDRCTVQSKSSEHKGETVVSRNEASNNAVLWPMAFASKSLISVETGYRN